LLLIFKASDAKKIANVPTRCSRHPFTRSDDSDCGNFNCVVRHVRGVRRLPFLLPLVDSVFLHWSQNHVLGSGWNVVQKSQTQRNRSGENHGGAGSAARARNDHQGPRSSLLGWWKCSHDVLEAVQTSVYPRVIDCPARGSSRRSLDAVAKDGIQLKVRARVTVRSNLQQLIGGATEETIIARVGEGMISKAVLARRLDSQTAFEIVSIDIADIDVGDNIGARLKADQAEADTRVARARAEGKRAMAVAQEQENTASIEQSRAALVAAESEVPKAMADSFRSGKLGILDYYKLRNVQADTNMRKSISGGNK